MGVPDSSSYSIQPFQTASASPCTLIGLFFRNYFWSPSPHSCCSGPHSCFWELASRLKWYSQLLQLYFVIQISIVLFLSICSLAEAVWSSIGYLAVVRIQRSLSCFLRSSWNCYDQLEGWAVSSGCTCWLERPVNSSFCCCIGAMAPGSLSLCRGSNWTFRGTLPWYKANASSDSSACTGKEVPA